MTMRSPRTLELHTPSGLRISGVEAGPEHAAAIVLLPGWPQTAYAWRHVQARLAEAGRRTLALDLPGMGGSDLLPAGEAYDIGRVADLIAAAVAEAGLEHFTLVGHDVGTWAAYAWAARRPEGIERLVLTEAAVPGVTAEGALPLAAAPKVFQFYFNALEELPEVLTAGRERAFLDWLFRTKTLVPGAIGPADLDLYAESYARPGRMSAGFGYYRALTTSIAQNKAAPAPAMPILALGGEGGVGDALLTGLKARSRAVEGGTMGGVGHYIPEEAPDLFTDRLLAFIGAGR